MPDNRSENAGSVTSIMDVNTHNEKIKIFNQSQPVYAGVAKILISNLQRLQNKVFPHITNVDRLTFVSYRISLM